MVHLQSREFNKNENFHKKKHLHSPIEFQSRELLACHPKRWQDQHLKSSQFASCNYDKPISLFGCSLLGSTRAMARPKSIDQSGEPREKIQKRYSRKKVTYSKLTTKIFTDEFLSSGATKTETKKCSFNSPCMVPIIRSNDSLGFRQFFSNTGQPP